MREYASHEWVDFLFEEKDPGTEAEQAVTNVIKESMEYLIDSCWRSFQVETWGEQRHLELHDEIDWFYLTFLAHCSCVGHGVGLSDAEDKFEQWLGVARKSKVGFLFDQFIQKSNHQHAVAFRVFSQDLDERIGLAPEKED